MTKSREIIQSSATDELSWADSIDDTKVYNPSSGYINIDTLDFSFDTGVELDSSPNLTMKRPRVTAGNEKIIPIKLSCYYFREDLDDATGLMESVYYLAQASKSGYAGLIYWMPNSDSEITSGEAQDYDTSVMHVLHDLEWEDAVLADGDTGYTGGTYSPSALPVIITDVTCKESAKGKDYSVTVDGYIISRES